MLRLELQIRGLAEILDRGRYSPRCRWETLVRSRGRFSVRSEEPADRDRLRARAQLFDRDRAVDRYLDVVLGTVL